MHTVPATAATPATATRTALSRRTAAPRSSTCREISQAHPSTTSAALTTTATALPSAMHGHSGSPDRGRLLMKLADRIGGLEEAVKSAARMAKLDEYRLREFPEQRSWLNEFFNAGPTDPVSQMKKEIGEDNYKIYRELLQIKQMTGSAQARLPFTYVFK